MPKAYRGMVVSLHSSTSEIDVGERAAADVTRGAVPFTSLPQGNITASAHGEKSFVKQVNGE